MEKRGLMNYYNQGGWWTLILGIICVLYGLGSFGFLFQGLPSYFFNDIGLKILLLIGGIFLLIDAFTISSRSGMYGGGMYGARSGNFIGVIVGVLLAVVGALPLLIEYKVLNFLPVLLVLNSNPLILAGLLIFYGGYLLVDFWLIKKYPSY